MECSQTENEEETAEYGEKSEGFQTKESKNDDEVNSCINIETTDYPSDLKIESRIMNDQPDQSQLTSNQSSCEANSREDLKEGENDFLLSNSRESEIRMKPTNKTSDSKDLDPGNRQTFIVLSG